MTRLQDLIKEIEINLLKIKKDLLIYKLLDDEYFESLTKAIDTELKPIFKKSWNKVDKIIKKQNQFINSQLDISTTSNESPTKKFITTRPTNEITQNNNTN
jgi:hypothetical protein